MHRKKEKVTKADLPFKRMSHFANLSVNEESRGFYTAHIVAAAHQVVLKSSVVMAGAAHLHVEWSSLPEICLFGSGQEILCQSEICKLINPISVRPMFPE